MTDKDKAIQEAERIAAADEYFKARAWLMDTNDNRRIFEAGFERAYALLSKLRAPVADERAAFEAWAEGKGLIQKSHGIMSVDSQCDLAREAWQAGRAALAIAPVATTTDRAMLQSVLQDLVNSDSVCPRCGHSDSCADMDVAHMIRDHLKSNASAPVAGEPCKRCGGPGWYTSHTTGYPESIPCSACNPEGASVERLAKDPFLAAQLWRKPADFADAYEGAREDLAIWKRRALEAERDLRAERETSSRLAAALNAENGPTHLGAPAPQASEAQCSCPSGDGSLRHQCAVHGADDAVDVELPWLRAYMHHQIASDRWVVTADQAREFAKAAVLADRQRDAIAWESTTPAYIKFVTDSRYRKFSPTVRKWYRPYLCSTCAKGSEGVV